ncbi:hypothetical protein HMI54_003217 [Coelomomyces lativittatus]|nr:hypothetical protein HMI54_003217 [Coelomomyces lativittatus]
MTDLPEFLKKEEKIETCFSLDYADWGKIEKVLEENNLGHKTLVRDDAANPLPSVFHYLEAMQPPAPNTPTFCQWVYEVKEKALPLAPNPCSPVKDTMLRIWKVYKKNCGIKVPAYLEVLSILLNYRKDWRGGYFTNTHQAIVHLVNGCTYQELRIFTQSIKDQFKSEECKEWMNNLGLKHCSSFIDDKPYLTHA